MKKSKKKDLIADGKNISDLQMKIFCQIKLMTEQKNKALTEEVEKKFKFVSSQGTTSVCM